MKCSKTIFYSQKDFKKPSVVGLAEPFGSCIEFKGIDGPLSFSAHSIKLFRKDGMPAVKCQFWA